MREKKNGKKIALLQGQGAFHFRAAKVTHQLFLENEFFDPHDMVQVKYEMLRWVHTREGSIKEAAKIFGLSRPSFYQAQTAFEQNGLSGLVPQKRGPKNRSKLSKEILTFVREMIEQDRSLTISNIVCLIKKQFDVDIHARSVSRALSVTNNEVRQEKK
jgi:transposase